jgi:hypothetical protein
LRENSYHIYYLSYHILASKKCFKPTSDFNLFNDSKSLYSISTGEPIWNEICSFRKVKGGGGMKRLLFLTLAIALTLTGCGDSSDFFFIPSNRVWPTGGGIATVAFEDLEIDGGNDYD